VNLLLLSDRRNDEDLVPATTLNMAYYHVKTK